MSHHDDDEPSGLTRRHALECMIWAGTCVLWAVAGSVPVSRAFLGSAQTAEMNGISSVQIISDSYVGFNRPANPHAEDTLMEAIAKVKGVPG